MRMDKQLQEEIKTYFDAPKPVEKREFIRKFPTRDISINEFIKIQAGYIRKPVWLMSILAFAIVIIGSYKMLANTILITASIVPFIAVLTVFEAIRSQTFHMAELERATRFSLRSIIFARMVIIGGFELLMFVIAVPVLYVSFGYSLIMTGAFLLVPYLATSIICMELERTTYARDNSYICVGVALAISVLSIWISGTYTDMFKVQYNMRWLMAVIILLFIMILEYRRFYNTSEVYA